MTFNFSALWSLKSEYESKFRTKIQEQHDRLNSKIQSETLIAFAEIAAFFQGMSKSRMEGEISLLEFERDFENGFIANIQAENAIKFSELLDRVKSLQQAKISAFMSKKDLIEAKIAELKANIALREGKLSELEAKLIGLQSSTNTDAAAVSQKINEIKVIQNELEKSHADSVDSMIGQKEIASEIKEVAVQVVKEKAEKVAESAKEAKNEETTTRKEVVDQEAKQLVFEFAKETEETIKKSTETSNIDENKLQEAKEVKTETTTNNVNNPQQLELPFDLPAKDKPAEETTSGNQKTLEDAQETSKKIDETKQILQIDDKEMEESIKNKTPEETVEPANPVNNPVNQDDKNEKLKKDVLEAKETVSKVKEVTESINENVDKKIEEMQNNVSETQSLLSSSKESTDKADATNTGFVALNASMTEEELQKTTESLKMAHEKQKETLEQQKESIAALEESARKLIDDVVGISNDENSSYITTETEEQKKVSLDKLKKLLEEARKMLDELIDSIKNEREKEDSTGNASAKAILKEAFDNIALENQNNNLNKMKLHSENSNNHLKKVNSEIFFISNKLNTTDDKLESFQKIASEAKKIVVDKSLPDTYNRLTSIFGEDKVVMDRRGQDDRRNTQDRRNREDTIVESVANTDEKRNLSSDRRDSSDRRQILPEFIFDMDKLELLSSTKDNRMA
jgi:hypothetical protein